MLDVPSCQIPIEYVDVDIFEKKRPKRKNDTEELEKGRQKIRIQNWMWPGIPMKFA